MHDPQNTTTNARFGALRAALHHPDRDSAWAELAEVLERWPRDAGLDDGVRYALDHTRSWEDVRCTAPRSWVARALDGEREPRLALATDVALAGHARDARRVCALLGQLGPRLTRLSLADMAHSSRLVGVAMLVARQPKLTGLRELDLRYTDFSDPAALLCSAASHLSALERIDARWTDLTTVGRSMLLRSRHLRMLREVEFTAYGSSLPGTPEPASLPFKDST